MKTAKQHNASQVGESEFIPGSNEAHIVGGNAAATAILMELFRACGWNVVTHKPKKYVDKIRRRVRRSRG